MYFMNIGDISVIISVLEGMIAIPFAASSVSTADDGNYGLAAILNSTPEFAANSSSSIPMLVSKTTNDEGIRYVYRTPYGEYSILISPEKFEETLLKAGKKVSALQSSSEQSWELSMPSESLILSHSDQKIIETYRNLNGYLRIITENGRVSSNMSGTAPIEELQAGMLRLETEMNETISLMKNMSEKILSATQETQTNQDYNISVTGINSTAEWIEIANLGNNADMTGWTLRDSSTTASHIFTFPAFVFYSNSSVRIYGADANAGCIANMTTLCWGSSVNVWNADNDVATLKNAEGTVITSYSY